MVYAVNTKAAEYLSPGLAAGNGHDHSLRIRRTPRLGKTWGGATRAKKPQKMKHFSQKAKRADTKARPG